MASHARKEFAQSNGGALYIHAGNTFLIESTLSQNSATFSGGGIYTHTGSLNAYNVTMAFNKGDLQGNGAGFGGGISGQTTVNLRNSLVAGNMVRSVYQDCGGTINSYGNGSALTAAAIGGGATHTAPSDIIQYADIIRSQLDADGNGTSNALTDGLMLVRYLFGLRGGSLITGAVGPGATRTTFAQIEAYIHTLMP